MWRMVDLDVPEEITQDRIRSELSRAEENGDVSEVNSADIDMVKSFIQSYQDMFEVLEPMHIEVDGSESYPFVPHEEIDESMIESIESWQDINQILSKFDTDDITEYEDKYPVVAFFAANSSHFKSRLEHHDYL
jgi:hypothetical protein